MSHPTSSSRLRVRYAETDQMGIVYHANYFVWFEVGRTDLLRDKGSTYHALEHDGFFLPVIEANCRFLQPAKYDDELDIKTTATLLSPARVKFLYEAVRAADNTVLATAFTVHASLDRDGKPCRLPERVRDMLEATP